MLVVRRITNIFLYGCGRLVPVFPGKIERKHRIFSRNIFSLLVAPALTAREEFCDGRHTQETFPVNCVYSQYEKGVGISRVKQSIFARRTTHVW